MNHPNSIWSLLVQFIALPIGCWMVAHSFQNHATTATGGELTILTPLPGQSRTNEMMRGYLRALAHRALDLRLKKIETLRTTDRIREYQRRTREFFVEQLGGFPARTPLRARIVGETKHADCRIERILYESQPRFFVPAMLYLLMRAPTPALILSATRDFVPIEGAWDAFRQAKRIFTRMGYPERVDLVEADEQHGFTLPLREGAGRPTRNGNPKIHVIAIGEAGPAALHAVALEPGQFASCTLQKSLVSWSSAVHTPVTKNVLIQTVHGALQFYDLPDLVGLAKKEVSVMIEAPVDAQGKAAGVLPN